MATISDLLGLGVGWTVASLVGDDISLSVVAAGTTQGTATSLGSKANKVITCVTGVTDGVKLPAAVPGLVIYVFNRGAGTLKVYPSTGGQIDDASVNSSKSLLTEENALFYAVDSTNWYAIVSS